MTKIEIELTDEGNMNTNSGFDLATTIVVLEKVKDELVERAQIRKQQAAGDDQEEEEDE